MGRIIWQNSEANTTEMTLFQEFVETKLATSFANYDSFQRWSVEDFESFWGLFNEYSGLVWDKNPTKIFEMKTSHPMLGNRWFPDGRLNFAKNLLHRSSEVTIKDYFEGQAEVTHLDGPELIGRVYDLQAYLKTLDLKPGDRVAAVASHTSHTLAAMLACASLGLVWASCSPDFGEKAIIDRMSQIAPKLIFWTPSYIYNGKVLDVNEKLPGVLKAIPTIESVVFLNHRESEVSFDSVLESVSTITDLYTNKPRGLNDLYFVESNFWDPLYILFSSGTTGAPKCIVHSVGGTLIQHKKEHLLHCDMSEKSNLLYFTTCGWMMWNWMVSALATGSSLTFFEGSVTSPDQDILWRVVSEQKVTHFGTSPKFLSFSEKAEICPAEKYDYSELKCVLSTGSPLLPEQFDWVYNRVKTDVHLASISGGTDIISCFILGNPSIPVKKGEIQCLGLGMAVEAWDENKKPVRNKKGELVCTKPFPSMPIEFLNDPECERYKNAYFNYYEQEQVWRHGDYIEILDDGGVVVYGRSDSTLNPGGVRIGTSELYRVVEDLEFVEDSIAIGYPTENDIEIWMFVVLKPGASYKEWKQIVARSIREKLSPRHVPAKIEEVADIPYTRSGKKVELAVKNIVLGKEVLNRNALRNPESLAYFSTFT